MTELINTIVNDPSVYKSLLESTKAIPWKIDWQTMKFTYIGPQIEDLLGWSPDSWVTVEDWASRIHADDRDSIVNFCVAQSQAGQDHEADYRALTKDGDYVWIRDVVHVVRKDGEVESLIGFMFDINERKENENELMHLRKKFEELSYQDSLTGVANRRMFDKIMEAEWARAIQNRLPVSLVLLDIDFFKEYNDHYGHIMGDECLKKVADILGTAAIRSRDFFARFGGEEFVLILPETEIDSATKVAERCRNLIINQQIPHDKSPLGQSLSISLGVSTIVPSYTDDPKDFINTVDRLLYKAKKSGRNCVKSG